MKDRISMLMDGELDDRGAAQVIDGLCRDREALELWRRYHLIGDAMRDCRLLSEGFAARVGQQLSREPALLAPRRAAPEPRRWRFALSAAATCAAIALVGWLAFAPQKTDEPSVALSKAPVAAPVQLQPAPPAIVPLPNAANDYLLAHQGFSPRLDLQGMAPYVRTVSDSNQDAR